MVNLGKVPVSALVDETYLAHYGVKGMHWGIRKDRNDPKSMSNEELQKAVNRMRLENQYKDLTKNPAVHAGRKQVVRYLNQSVNVAMTAILTATIGSYIKNWFEHPENRPEIKMPDFRMPDINDIPGFRRSWV